MLSAFVANWEFRTEADIRSAPEDRISRVKWQPECRLSVMWDRSSVVGTEVGKGQHVLFSTKSVPLVMSMRLLESCAETVHCGVPARS